MIGLRDVTPARARRFLLRNRVCRATGNCAYWAVQHRDIVVMIAAAKMFSRGMSIKRESSPRAAPLIIGVTKRDKTVLRW